MANNSTKQVIFCDDNLEAFWLSTGGRVRAGWSDNEWSGWEVFRISAPGQGGQWVPRFLAAINGLPLTKPFYIVTDANFGRDQYGGARLLMDLFTNGSLSRGVVFSVDPKLISKLERYREKSRCCTVRDQGNNSLELAEKIKHFLLRGEEPDRSQDSMTSDLSRSIHSIENLVGSIKMDVQTLNSDMEVNLNELCLDYFSRGEPEGYLTEGRKFTEGAKGIEQEIMRIIESIRWIPSLNETLQRFFEGEELKAEKIASELGIASARELDDKKCKSDPDILSATLTGVLDKVNEFITELKKIRETIQKMELLRS